LLNVAATIGIPKERIQAVEEATRQAANF